MTGEASATDMDGIAADAAISAGLLNNLATDGVRPAVDADRGL